MHSIHRPMPQPRIEYPGLTPAVRGKWQSVGNAGVACQVLAWAMCRFGAEFGGRGYGLIFGLLGICAFLAEFYGRLRYRKRQLPFPKGYSLCRYIGFFAVTAAAYVLYRLDERSAAILLLGGGLMLVWLSLNMDKRQRCRLREQREMEET